MRGILHFIAAIAKMKKENKFSPRITQNTQMFKN